MALKEAGASVHIAVPRSEAWEKLRDMTLANNYVPGVVEARIDTEKREGVGASRTVIMENGSEMQETVEEWNEGNGFLIRLHKGEKPAMPIFKRFYFRYLIEDEGEGTRFAPALLYETRFGPVGALLGKLAHGQMQKSANDVGLAMKEFYETGRPLTPERMDQLRAADEAKASSG